jgi:hypothetical protein
LRCSNPIISYILSGFGEARIANPRQLNVFGLLIAEKIAALAMRAEVIGLLITLKINDEAT